MLDLSKILAVLPTGLRNPLIESYQEIGRNYGEHRWEPSELNGGKFSEIVYTILNGYIAGNFASKPSKPSDIVAACRALERIPPSSSRTGDRSVRILIPRVLQALYEIRNNRGVGHVGGDINPNFLDATVVFSMTSWILAELIRIFHNISTKEAQGIVDLLIERKIPLIWDLHDVGIKRVLNFKMEKSDQALLLLHPEFAWVSQEDLCKWVEYSSLNMFRRRILEPLHKERFLEYNDGKIKISPLGVQEVEKRILKTK